MSQYETNVDIFDGQPVRGIIMEEKIFQKNILLLSEIRTNLDSCDMVFISNKKIYW